MVQSYLDELHKGDKKAPRMRSIRNEAFQQNSCYLLLDNFLPNKELQSCDHTMFCR